MQFRKHLFSGATGHKTTKCFQSAPFLPSSQLTRTLHRLCHVIISFKGEVIVFNREATKPYSHLTLQWHNVSRNGDYAPHRGVDWWALLIGEGVVCECEFASLWPGECFVSSLCRGGQTLSHLLEKQVTSLFRSGFWHPLFASSR